MSDKIQFVGHHALNVRNHNDYDINFQPTHIILNRDGKITQRITDAGIHRLKRLRALINYALY